MGFISAALCKKWQADSYQVHKELIDDSSNIYILGGAHGVMVIIVGNGHGDMSSNPGRDWLHFA